MDGIFIPIIAIIFGCGIPIIAIWSKHKEKIAAMERGIILDDKGKPVGTTQDNRQTDAELLDLRERIKVLERIVTDGSYDVATQIEALRDTKPAEAAGSGVPLNMQQKERA